MRKFIFISILTLLALAGLFVYQYFKFNDGKLHVVFCDVGQGDGILIMIPSAKQILIDAGPDSKILDCLSKHMPFWDRKIELALLTHPHADHFTGYYYVIDRYSIDHFASEELRNKSDGFMQLEKQLKQFGIPTKYVYAGDRWLVPSYAKASEGKEDIVIRIEAPTRKFIFDKNPDGFITNSAESASLITKISYGDFSALFTGDAPLELMKELRVSDLDVLQIPHHGSNTGIDENVLDLLAPKLAAISVGKNNYGHPTKRVLNMFLERGLKILRTDQMGDIEFVSDGKNMKLN